MRFNSILSALLIVLAAFGCDNMYVGSGADSTTGQGGSLTRFAINGNYMYVVDNSHITVFSIGDDQFHMLRELEVGNGMETIFARGEYLYLGSRDAMYIYSIADPEQPSFVFRYAHIVSCDPVVVQGNRAYVTMSSGEGMSFCNRGVNALEIIDISDPYNPTFIANYPMTSPHGLGVDGNLLFICDGIAGLKLYDITNEHDIHLVDHRDDMFAYDVIARSGLATITGEDGIFQFSYGPDGLTLISTIPVLRAEL